MWGFAHRARALLPRKSRLQRYALALGQIGEDFGAAGRQALCFSAMRGISERRPRHDKDAIASLRTSGTGASVAPFTSGVAYSMKLSGSFAPQ